MVNIDLPQNTFSPRQFQQLYSTHVRPISYATVLAWIKRHEQTGDGIAAHREVVSGYYRIPVAEVARILGKHEVIVTH